MVLPELLKDTLLQRFREVWLTKGNGVVGIEPNDPLDQVDALQRYHAGDLMRRFAHAGTAGDRNVHVMSGRVHQVRRATASTFHRLLARTAGWASANGTRTTGTSPLSDVGQRRGLRPFRFGRNRAVQLAVARPAKIIMLTTA